MQTNDDRLFGEGHNEIDERCGDEVVETETRK